MDKSRMLTQNKGSKSFSMVHNHGTSTDNLSDLAIQTTQQPHLLLLSQRLTRTRLLPHLPKDYTVCQGLLPHHRKCITFWVNLNYKSLQFLRLKGKTDSPVTETSVFQFFF